MKEQVEFVLNAPWKAVLGWLGKSWVGVNAMWNEHFGIGVVEYLAAGLVGVVHDSGGPKEDIVVEGLGMSSLSSISLLPPKVTPCDQSIMAIVHYFTPVNLAKYKAKKKHENDMHSQQVADNKNRLPRNRYSLLRLRIPQRPFPPSEGCTCSEETCTGILCTILRRGVCQGMAGGNGGHGRFDAAEEEVFLIIIAP